MLPHISQTIVDKLSLLDNGLLEVTGRAALSDSKAAADSTPWLKLTRRGTTQSHLVPVSLDTDGSGDSLFRFEIDLRNDAGALEEDDIVDAHLVLKSNEGDAVSRLPWPRAFSSWTVYPTAYGNLSLKKSPKRPDNE